MSDLANSDTTVEANAPVDASAPVMSANTSKPDYTQIAINVWKENTANFESLNYDQKLKVKEQAAKAVLAAIPEDVVDDWNRKVLYNLGKYAKDRVITESMIELGLWKLRFNLFCASGKSYICETFKRKYNYVPEVSERGIPFIKAHYVDEHSDLANAF